MNALVFFAILGMTCAAPFLQDTPEVVAERARFQQLYNAAAAAAAAAPDPPMHGGFVQQAPVVQFAAPQPAPAHTSVWRGPVAATIPAGVPGSSPQVADTADVTAARNAFLAAYRAQVAATTGQQPSAAVVFSAPVQAPPAPGRWVGPVAATQPAGVGGVITPVAPTADVVAAQNAFFAAYNQAVAATLPATASAHHQPAVVFATHQTAPVLAPIAKWTGPVAATVPAGLPGSVSQVGPTQEVAAATHAFTQAYNAAVAATTGRRF